MSASTGMPTSGRTRARPSRAPKSARPCGLADGGGDHVVHAPPPVLVDGVPLALDAARRCARRRTGSASSTSSASGRVSTRSSSAVRRSCSSGSERPARASASAARTSSKPSRRTATVGTTGTSSRRGELLDVDLHALGLRLVHHVERDDHGDAHVDDLLGEEEVALQVDGVDHVEDDVGLHDDVARHRLLVVERRDAVDAGRVQHDVVAHAPAGDGDGRAGVVGDVDVEAGERVEEERLADVGVADQDDPAGVGRGVDGRRRDSRRVAVAALTRPPRPR